MRKFLVMYVLDGQEVYCLRKGKTREEAIAGMTKVIRAIEL